MMKKIGTRTTQYTFLKEKPSSSFSLSSVLRNASSTMNEEARMINRKKMQKYFRRPCRNRDVHTFSCLRKSE